MTGWQRAWPWLVLVKAAYLAAVSAALCLWPDLDEEKFDSVMRHWPQEGGPVFASHFTTWDGAHYLYLSEVGCARNVASCAFYPLWPLLLGSVLTGGGNLVAGMVLANVFSLAAWLFFYGLAVERFGEKVAQLSVIFLIMFPGALFFQFIYSEPVFFLLVMVFWRGLLQRKLQWVWLAGSLLPLCRPVGVFCLLPLGRQLLREVPPAWWLRMEKAARLRATAWREKAWGAHAPPRVATGASPMEFASARALGEAPALPVSDGDGASTSAREGACGPRNQVPIGESLIEAGGPLALPAVGDRRDACPTLTWWLLLGPLLGWGMYLGMMWSWTGDAFEGFKAQRHWGVHSVWNLVNIPKFVVGFFTPTEWHAFSGSLLDRCVFILLLYCLPLIWRLDKTRSLFVWTYVLGILPAMSGTFTSYTRFASVCFPIFIALAVFLADDRRRLLRWATIVAFGVLHVVLLWRFVNFRWAG